VASTIVITRADLQAGQLRIEGTGARPNAAITITAVNGTSQAVGTTDAAGNFRIQTTGFSAPTCTATVTDGTSTTTTPPLNGC
jgi:hypothetical protein